MPLINRFLTSRKSVKRTADCKLPVDIGTETNTRSTLNFGVDQVRILLFRECEWRGRTLLFDSITAGRNNGSKSSTFTGSNISCSRNGNGLPYEENEVCDNINLLSEMIFGTVAMTYRGALFKIHTIDSSRCVMCTKVFPAPDHNTRKHSSKLSDETLGVSLINADSNSSNGSTRNTLSCPSSGNISGNSLRKSSTCSSTCSGWEIDTPAFPLLTGLSTSHQSTETCNSISSSGFGSLTSLRRRWLKAVSTSLNHSEMNQTDDIFGFQTYSTDTIATSPSTSTSGDICDYTHRRHKTRLGLTVIIKLTPGEEKEIEVRLFEHAHQVEAILNRLCHACMNPVKGKGLIHRLHQASFQCTVCLLRLLITTEKSNLSLWHEIILNTSIHKDNKINMVRRSFQEMCHLLNTIDTKSTNFFLSTIVTAVLTYHLGWVNTVISLKEKTWLENIKKKYPCNPLWIQLSDLYGTLGNPSKLVHTVITGDSEASSLINSILTFLSYFIRSTVVKKRHLYRESSEEVIQEAISIIEKKLMKIESLRLSSTSSNLVHCAANIPQVAPVTGETSRSVKKPVFAKKSNDLNIPELKKTRSLHNNLDLKGSNFNLLKLQNKLPLQLDSSHDDLDGSEKQSSDSNLVKIIVNDEKCTSKPTLTLDDFDEKVDWRNPEVPPVVPKSLSSIFNQNDFDTMKDVASVNASGFDETEIYFSQIDYTSDKQNQVFFTIGGEEKNVEQKPMIPTNSCNCQSSFAFTRVPSTSAQLPEGVLRKILQRNFPESSKSIQRPGTSLNKDRTFGFSCPKCNGNNSGRNYEGTKLLLETPTNATEVLRTCSGSAIGIRGEHIDRSDSLEELLEVNNFIELPMPRSKKVSSKQKEDVIEITGFTNTLLRRQISKQNDQTVISDAEYTSGLVIQGFIKKHKTKNKRTNTKKDENDGSAVQIDDWFLELRDDVNLSTRFPIFDQSISEVLCIVADIDNWQVGIISNTIPIQRSLLPVGMSKLVSEMLEAFVYLWTKYKSPLHCFNILEFKMREMWLRSEALAELLMTVDICNINLGSLTNALDLDAADIPLLLAVATTHSPQIAHRIGFTYT